MNGRYPDEFDCDLCSLARLHERGVKLAKDLAAANSEELIVFSGRWATYVIDLFGRISAPRRLQRELDYQTSVLCTRRQPFLLTLPVVPPILGRP